MLLVHHVLAEKELYAGIMFILFIKSSCHVSWTVHISIVYSPW